MRLATLLVVAAGVACPAVASAQAPAAGDAGQAERSVRILRVETAPRIDGHLNDGIWQAAEPASGFVQRDPLEGAAASEATEVRIASDGRNLFFGVRCADRDPGGILSRELRRDAELTTDDSFALILDTFHDHRNGFLFRINPQGAQFDALVTDEGRHVNTTWDEQWEVETNIDATGWTAEIRIPLSAIRFEAADGGRFGIDFERVIRRKNEFTYWNSFARSYTFERLSQAGHLTGIEGLAAASRLRIKPYLNSRIYSRGAGDPPAKLHAEVGLEDLKYSITPSLTFDLTLNTDFAQAEVDEVVVNFDRVPVLFPEKRDFFLEGAGQFEFGGVRGEGGAELKLYHSRRIGLSESGQAIPILAGAKLAGKIGDKYTVGLLTVQTDDASGQPGSNFGVVRLQRNLFARSAVGLFATSRQSGGADYNRVAGVDATLAVLDHLTLTGLAARSFTHGVAGEQGFGAVGAAWTDDLINGGFDVYRIGSAFRTDLGFLERLGVTKYGPYLTVSPRPTRGPVRQFGGGVRLDHYVRNDDGTVETQIYHFNSDIAFQNGSGVRVSPHRRFEDLRVPLRLPGGLTVPPGRYTWWYFPATYRFNPAHKVTGSVQYRLEPDYFGAGGRRQTWNLTPVIRLTSHVSARIDYSWNRVQLPGGAPVDVHVANNTLDVSFNRRWLTSTIFQYSNARDLVGLNFRLRYRYGSNHDLFVVVNSVRSDVDLLRVVDRSLTVKLTRSFDF